MSIQWSSDGYCALSGLDLALYEQLDKLFCSWAADVSAVEHQFPNLIAKQDLDRIDYFASFGHLATTVEQCNHALTPAACYHFYSALKNTQLDKTSYFTTRANCFRRESSYSALRRQWCFGMREIVCLGSRSDVLAFLDHYRQSLAQAFDELRLPVQFMVATDPFFNPEKNPKYLMQKIDPVKHEMVFAGDLAIGSMNDHRTTFGEAFNITLRGEPMNSACVAFGLERWMHACMETHGENAMKVITQ